LIRAKRTARELSLQEVADGTGLSKPQVHRYETGGTPIMHANPKRISRLLEFLGGATFAKQVVRTAVKEWTQAVLPT